MPAHSRSELLYAITENVFVRSKHERCHGQRCHCLQELVLARADPCQCYV